jgi:RNA polymerase sigma-70 factor (ECF subfamily)
MMAQKDLSEFETLVMPHLDAAHNLARWLLRDPVVTEDVVQTAIVRALTYFSGFRAENPRAWLLQIVRNAAHGWLADQRGHRHHPLHGEDDGGMEDWPDPAPGPEAEAAGREALGRLDTMLASMPVDLRECLILREIEDLSYREIAEITGAPIGTVMSRLWRARQWMMARMEATP